MNADATFLMLQAVDTAVEDHRSAIETVRRLFSERLDRESGMDADELFDLDRLLASSAEALDSKITRIFHERREEFGIPHRPPLRGGPPHLRLEH